MARPSERQQLRARNRIRAIIEMRGDGLPSAGQLPRYVFTHKRGIIAGLVAVESIDGTVTSVRDIYSKVPKYGLGSANTFGFPKRKRGQGETKRQSQLRIGRLLGYKGKESNIVRSVNRLIMRDRESKQARSLRSTKQVERVDRSFNYYRKKTGVGVIDKNLRLDIQKAVKPKIDFSDFIANNESVFNDNREFEPTDVVHIFNMRMRMLLSQEDDDSKAYSVIFDESALDSAEREALRRMKAKLVLFARDVVPDNDNMTTVVVQ
jgi:hypothetical protein